MTHALIAAGFDVSQLTLGTLTLATAGKSDVVINLSAVTGLCQDGVTTTTKHFHVYDAVYLNHFYAQNSPTGLVDTLTDWSILTYARCLRVFIRAGMTSASWVTPTGFDIVFNQATNQFAFGYTAATFSMTWSVAAGRQLMGFSGNSSGATLVEGLYAYASDQLPFYLFKPTLPMVSEPTGNYELERIATHAVPDNGAHEGYGISRLRAPLGRDLTLGLETYENTYRLHALSTAPFTIQHLVEHCRGTYPFIISNGGWPTFIAGSFPSAGTVEVTSEIFMLLGESTRWKSEYHSKANAAQNDWKAKLQVVAMMVWE